MTWPFPLKVALVASVALNLFVLGAAAGLGIARLDARHALQTTRAPPSLWAAAQALPPAQRAAFDDLLRDSAQTLRPDVRAARDARREAARLIAAPVYDPVAVGAAIARARSAESRVRNALDATLLAYVGRLPSDARAALADAVVHGRLGPRRAQDPAAAAR